MGVQGWRRATVVWVVIASLAGCAMTPQRFASSAGAMSDVRVCRSLADATASGDSSFVALVSDEAGKRSLSSERCEALIREENQRAALILGAIAIGIAAAAAKHGGGGGGATSGPPTDYEWDWDEIRNEFGRLVWVCRGVQSGQFAELWHCGGKVKTDWRWPGK